MPPTASAIALERFAVKIFATDAERLDLGLAIPVFHRWIQTKRVDGLLIDVADYRHVPDGPGLLLVGHEADYALDSSEGPPGLIYSRKRLSHGSNAERLRAALRKALTACRLLEEEPEFERNGLRFAGERLRLIVNDRRVAPDADTVLDTLGPDLGSLARQLYPQSATGVDPGNSDPRDRVAFDIRTTGPVAVRTLLERLG